MDTAACVKFLSNFLDKLLVGTREEVDINRKSIVILDCITTEPFITTGSRGDGFDILCSDLDRMLILTDTIALYEDTKQDFITDSRTKTILLIEEGSCRPGYINLKIDQIGNTINEPFKNAIVPTPTSFYLSSDIYREEMTKELNTRRFESVSTGPSHKLLLPSQNSQDCVNAFLCCNWPHDAHEWICRIRFYDWPTKSMVKHVVNEGCHVVPVGDKCSEDTLLQWRISFAAAERYLVHSLNHIQFNVYGLLKYLLKQIEYRMKHDTGEDDILCSYFMKTVLFYAVENSPRSLWQEKNIFVCYQLCLNMLLDWVHLGYCPNYFIKTSNMFQRKVHGENKVKLLNILCEVSDMKWQSLSIGSAYRVSIGKAMQIPSIKEAVMEAPTLTQRECKRDIQIIRSMVVKPQGVSQVFLSIRKVMALLFNAASDIDEVLIYHALTYLLELMSMQRFEKHGCGNKFMYICLRKYKHWLSKSFGTDKLYLATFLYHTGSYMKAIELCRNIGSSICPYENNVLSSIYQSEFCGRGYSLIYKLKQAYYNDIRFGKYNLQFCLPRLHMEVRDQHPYSLCIPPKPYAMFLSFMCYQSVGETVRRDEVLNDLEAVKYDDVAKTDLRWIIYTLIGICYETKGDYRNAIKAYQGSLTLNRTRNPALERIGILQASVDAAIL